MFELIKKLFASGPKVDYRQLVSEGAQIIDVRTKMEFNGGHIKGSKNIPLQVLGQNLKSIHKDKPVIAVCASGSRSAAARSILLANGFKEVYNGGGYYSLQSKLGN
ncbi:MAG: rhodanese-like domain-containing protein [Saprospiraceae bacterium]|nr:rhodanese-like domain-containing protein [Saprospiraceae bacterium]HMW39014.1 rhodanese-like domain-containing protein [Saprospiraceae bacterium]HMX87039.1 rhodanese-like domain-containing protein [Saprospiraceae bacterium]HMZ41248.1 rhodanese-like domain-containing protein [Saprospiraceae bacterium]HNA63514.1 rhodanese-like domain-containing protein [Saprospiraceae bacterium]